MTTEEAIKWFEARLKNGVPMPAARSAFQAAIDALKEQDTNKWIPCSERLPEERLYVLVTYVYIYGMVDRGIEYVRNGVWTGSRNVTAWMPLPEPYKEDTK